MMDRVDDLVRTEAVPDLSEGARAKGGETVLAVEDEPTVRMLVTAVPENLDTRPSRRRT